ncbi:MAG: SDR family oxidoreductase [Deltaproteobacteria bacterium]|nr:SDR family oxidoreductase [Deltaproteobacteria bacterium]
MVVILVTGNQGYIGTVMTKMLKEASYKVLGLDNDWFKEGYFFYPDDILPDKQITKDIRHITDNDLDGVEAVIHLAAISNDPLGELNPCVTEQINTHATIQLAKLCKKRKIGRFIFASSCSIYGIVENGMPISEQGILNPQTAYAKAKVNAENQLKELANDNFHPILMRNATVYGSSPKLRLDLVVNQLAAYAYLTGEIRVLSDGTPWRPLIHIEDFCRAFMKILEVPKEKNYQVFNVGINNGNYQIKDIAFEIQKSLPHTKIKIARELQSDERTYRVDFSKIKESLDFKPRWNLKKGIMELIEDFKKNDLTLNDFKSNKYFRIRTIQSYLETKKMDKNLFWL